MYLDITPSKRHNNMAAIHSSDTKPELLLRHALWKAGFRYRTNVRSLPGSPDIVLPRYRTAVFVNGCFWHGHRGCRSYTVPKTNTEFWVAKVARNQERDQVVWRMLEAKGWSVVIVWECELKKARLDATVDRVFAEIRRKGERYREFQATRRKAREEYRREQRARKERDRSLLEEIKHYNH